MNKKFEIPRPLDLFEKLYKEFQKEIRIIVLFLFAGVITYFPMITDFLTNGDSSAVGVYIKNAHKHEVILGRFGIAIIDKIRANAVVPVFITLLDILIIGMIALVIYKLFDITDAFSRIVIGALLLFSPSVANTLTYYYCSDSYFWSYFLAVLAVLFLSKKNTVKNFVMATGCILVSLSIYQAYIGITITLCIIWLLYAIIIHKRDKLEIKALYMIGSGGAGLILYALIFKIIRMVFNLELEESYGFDEIGFSSISDFFERISNAYKDFYIYFFNNDFINNSFQKRAYINLVICIVLLCAVICAIIYGKLKWLQIVEAIVLLVVLPIALGITAIISPVRPMGLLMVMQMNLLYVFAFIIFRKLGYRTIEKVLSWGGYAGILGIVFVLCLYVFAFQHCLKLNLNKSISVGNEIVNTIEESSLKNQQLEVVDEENQEEENASKIRIMIGGCMERGNYPFQDKELFEIVKGSVAYQTMFWDSGMQSECWAGFIKANLGRDYDYVDASEHNKLLERSEYKEMTVYPDEGSVRYIDDVLIIKLSD